MKKVTFIFGVSSPLPLKNGLTTQAKPKPKTVSSRFLEK